jgi:quinol monooxygenase YgiN
VLAQVFTAKGIAGDAYGREIAEATRQLDGCEGIYLLMDGSAEGLGIALWRDRAAMEAAAAKERTDIDQAATNGISVTLNNVYDTVISL